MSSKYAQPKWWQLYFALPLLIALFMLDHSLTLSTLGHQAVQIGILVLVYGYVHLWLKANATLVSKMEPRGFKGTVTVIRVPPHHLSDVKRTKLQLPNSEPRGTLSDTFEMDYIDAEFVLVDKAVENSKKE